MIENKRITTTVAKAKALRQYVEPLINRSKEDSTHSRRMVFRSLKSKEAVTELFREVAPKVATREGGYTRIIKTGFRLGDAAEMCMIELVDFNELYGNEQAAKSKSKRSRRGGAKKKEATVTGESEVTAVETTEETKSEDIAPEADSAEDSSEEKDA